MNIQESYILLNVNSRTPDEAITSRYKKLALMYHPDRNRKNVKAANENMTRLNIAYNTIMSYRFKNNLSVTQKTKTETETEKTKKEESVKKQPAPKRPSRPQKPFPQNREMLIQNFILIREKAKDSLYRYFQYNLYNIPSRENLYNQGIYNRIIYTLRKSYHSILDLARMTDEPDLIEHFNVFNNMLFDFYRAAECLNIIDSYTNQREVDAYRAYKSGDESLHLTHREIFYDRHNRGFIKKEEIMNTIVKAEKLFTKVIKHYPDTSWSVEAQIKLSYTRSLISYFELFFLDEE